MAKTKASENSRRELDAVLRRHAEQEYSEELSALQAEDKGNNKPANWNLSPKMVLLYLMGGKTPSGKEIVPKYVGPTRLMEIAISTLATDRALLLYGMPGTAKSWVAEHLAAAISGDSTLLIQGTAGTDESALRYGWNYARLLSEGPSKDALVESPTMRGMRLGKLVRVEELTRVASDVQDALITILSEKTLPIPELNEEVQAQKGFNIIATANDRDRGVNELSSALMRRFNVVVLPPPATLDEEVQIVERRVAQIGRALELPVEKPAVEEIRRVVTIFRELRNGATIDGKSSVRKPSGSLSTAEAISVVNSALATSGYFGDGSLTARDLALGVYGAVVKDATSDAQIWKEYVQTIVKKRDGWQDLYLECSGLSEK